MADKKENVELGSIQGNEDACSFILPGTPSTPELNLQYSLSSILDTSNSMDRKQYI